MTDRDIQEGYFNRDVREWRRELVDDDGFRDTLSHSGMESEAPAGTTEPPSG